MKIGGSKKKKGVSAVVATILIVMITVLAIGIIWVTILPMIRENLAVSDVCENAGVSIISSQGYTCYKPNNITMVQVSKANTEANVTGLKFSISSYGNSYDYDEQEVAYSTNDYNVYYLNTSEFSKIEKISVVPTVKFGDSEKSCSSISLEDIPLCSASANLVEASAGKLISRSGGSLSSITPGCVTDCSCSSTLLIGQTCPDGCGGNCQGTKRDGSLLAPFAIYNCEQLQNMSNNLTASYDLVNDIDCAGFKNLDGSGFNPIGLTSNIDYSDFTGILEGNGFVVKNLALRSYARTMCGEWSCGYYSSRRGFIASSSGTIKNIGFVNGSYSRPENGVGLGGIVGVLNTEGVIENSFFSGTFNGAWDSGLLVAINYGTISNSYSNGSVSSHYYSGSSYYPSIGGLVGRNYGTISNSYSTASAVYTGGPGWWRAGGLVGQNEGTGKITSSYSTGTPGGYGGFYLGGFVGQNNGEISNSYWDNQTSGKTNMCYAGTCDNSFGKTTIQMKNISTFSTWDSTNVWNLTQDNYPKLKWQN
jgi:FlaG/FlaF family flagellin (archaellin)